jgi:TonB family protein
VSAWVYQPRFDVRESRSRTRRTMAASFLLHLLLLAWIVFHPAISASRPNLTEIAYLEPGDLDTGSPAPASGPPAAAPRPAPGLLTANTEDARFEREKVPADIAPDPQSPTATEDRLRTRLAALQRDALTPAEGPGTSPAASPAWGAAGVPGTIGGDGHGPVNLARGGSGTGTSLELTRGGAGHGVAPALAPTSLPADHAENAAPAQGGETARRNVAGASLAGPIADRAILQMTQPVYPDWAKKEAVEGSVTLYFIVRPDGSVKENVLVQKTAGFQDFDESARTALRSWRFEALRAGRTGEQWGTITFHFRLRDSG